jgi:hypothetical protein
MPLILGTNSIKDTGYDVANSCRFDDGSSDRLTKTYSSSGDRNKFTFSMWLKRSQISNTTRIFGVYQNAQYSTTSYISGGGNFVFIDTYNSGEQAKAVTDMVFRDVSAWYNIIVVYDRNNSTSADKLIIYVNGERVSLSTYTAPSQATTLNSDGLLHEIGAFNNSDFYDGYISEFVFCDGQALDQTSFGEFDSDTNIWKPIDVSGLTFGTNGFYLDYEDSSSLGNDAAGSNNFTVSNLTAIDQSTDTCTNNSATIGTLFTGVNSPTYSEGNLQSYSNAAFTSVIPSSIGLASGKWYAELKYAATTSNDNTGIGIGHDPASANRSNTDQGGYSINYYASGYIDLYGSNGGTFSSYTVGDIIGIYMDIDNQKLYFSKNGTLQNSGTGLNITTSTTGFYYFQVADFTSTSNFWTWQWNFGAGCPFAISSGNTDDNGYGNFEYSPNITGDSTAKKFYACNTKNLAEYG